MMIVYFSRSCLLDYLQGSKPAHGFLLEVLVVILTRNIMAALVKCSCNRWLLIDS